MSVVYGIVAWVTVFVADVTARTSQLVIVLKVVETDDEEAMTALAVSPVTRLGLMHQGPILWSGSIAEKQWDLPLVTRNEEVTSMSPKK